MFLPFFTDSGMSSQQATATIAPAAKLNRNGNMLDTYTHNKNAKSANIGSTMPDSIPMKKDFRVDMPCALSGSATAAPSGIFCMPIPNASIKAAPIVVTSAPKVKEPNATPTAIPSGMLWNVIEPTKITLFLNVLCLENFSKLKNLSSILSDQKI